MTIPCRFSVLEKFRNLKNLSPFKLLCLEKIIKKGYYITIMKPSMSLMAAGSNYFASPECPIGVRTVRDASQPRHEHDYTTRMHQHDFSELVFIGGGSGIQVINDVEYPVVAGDVFLIQGYCEHGFKSMEQLSLTNVMFDPGRLPLPLKFLRKLPGFNVIFRLEPTLRSRRNFKNRLHLPKRELAAAESMVQRLAGELTAQSDGFEAAALGILLELVTFVSRHYASQHADNRAALVRMGELISRLERDYIQDWNLARLARLAGTSPNNLLRLFKAATGDSPIDYLIKLRLRHGAFLLADRTRSVSEVAELCGFRDSNYFSKKFRVLYGVSPREYRRRLEG